MYGSSASCRISNQGEGCYKWISVVGVAATASVSCIYSFAEKETKHEVQEQLSIYEKKAQTESIGDASINVSKGNCEKNQTITDIKEDNSGQDSDSGSDFNLRWPEFEKLKVLSNKPLNYESNTYILRIGLESSLEKLDCPLGGVIQLRAVSDCVSENFPFGKLFCRTYVPVSWPNKCGHFDVIYKVYYGPEGGMSNHLKSLRKGSTVEVRSVRRWLDKTIFNNSNAVGNDEVSGDVYVVGEKQTTDGIRRKHYGMIAGGSGLTTMLQIIRRMLLENEEATFSLIISDRTHWNIFYDKELTLLAEKYLNRLCVFRTLTRDYPRDWEQGIGRITKEMLEEHIDMENADAIFVCGPDGFVNHICGKNVAKNVRTRTPKQQHVISPVESTKVGGLLHEITKLNVENTKIVVF